MSEANTVWYRRVLRWGQTNLTEIDPVRYDGAWWREHWQRTRVQGVIVNAGGIVAYYPSRYELQHRAEYLGDRDLYGEISAAAREDGLSVVARMDSNRADHRFFTEHPDWFTVDAEGRPYRAGDLYISCVNSPYYDEYLPGIFEEVIERYGPDGFADNSWSGLQRDRICYCVHCRRTFREHTGAELPTSHDWRSATYRAWIRWNYDRRLEIWDLNNAVTQRAGGKDCLWVGMNAGEITAQSKHFRDYRAIAQRAEVIFLDSQFRHAGQGFQRNGEMGAALHGMLGWDKLIPESMAMYGAGVPAFRLSSKSEPDARLWALDGFSGGIQPWWHHIGAYHDDRRQYRTAEPLFRWHEANESALMSRRPAATVGVVWSQENVDYYGADRTNERYSQPWTGMTDALIRARIPYTPVHADDIGRESEHLAALVLPNVGLLSDSQIVSIRAFVAAGGGLLATGESSLCAADGSRRENFTLGDLFGVEATGVHHGSETDNRESWDEWGQHTYLRLHPERRHWIDGPQTGSEPDDETPRHEVLGGLDETDTMSFGGRIEVVRVSDGA
ncbi:MAG: alpha-amylase family protein, partial [Thermomicrobiales bacterium]